MLQFILEQLFEALWWYLTHLPVQNANPNSSSQIISNLEDNEESFNTDLDTSSRTKEDQPLVADVISDRESESNLSGRKTFQIQVCYLDSEQKKICRYNMTVQRSMKVQHIKQQLHRQLIPDVGNNIEHWSNLAILFMGKELPDNLDISGCDLGDQSMIHALDSVKAKSRSRGQMGSASTKTFNPPITELAKSSEDIETLNKLPRILTTIEQEPSEDTQGDEEVEEDVDESGFEMVQSNQPFELVAEDSASIAQHSPSPAKLYFFVYCESCGELRNGKLRVVCATCDQGSILLNEEPKDWTDVLTSGKIRSNCFTPNCCGDRARFFFKCFEESSHRPQLELPQKVLPLNRIRHNNISAACLACMDHTIAVVLVFPCGHVVCLDCFRDYCRTCLSERNLALQSPESLTSYSVNCPLDCSQSWLEVDHFRLLNQSQYALYRKLAQEEFVLKNGGVICPYPQCDGAFYPGEDKPLPPESCQVNECEKCHLVYCVRCTFQGQYASMFCQFETLIEQTNAQLRTEQSSSAAVTDSDDLPQTSSSYLSALISKFNLLRLGSSSISEPSTSGSSTDTTLVDPGTKSRPLRWQDTMSRMKILEIAKPCPKCRTPTERSEGCMHMVCTRNRCNFHWCWICQIEWTNDCMATHWFG